MLQYSSLSSLILHLKGVGIPVPGDLKEYIFVREKASILKIADCDYLTDIVIAI